jgi:hypothetical protein
MQLRINPENTAAEALLPPAARDGSGVGVNYADAYLKAIHGARLEDQPLSCKRKGLKIVLGFGGKTGEALLRKREHGPDARNILRQALNEAAQALGAQFVVQDGVMYLLTAPGEN